MLETAPGVIISHYDYAKSVRAYVTEHSVSLVVKYLCEALPDMLPNIYRWKVDNPAAFCPYVHALCMTETFIEDLVPTLEMMLGDSASNYRWAAQITMVYAVYQAAYNISHQRSKGVDHETTATSSTCADNSATAGPRDAVLENDGPADTPGDGR